MIVVEIVAENPAQVVLVKDDDMIDTVPPDAADQSLNEWVLPRTLWRSLYLLDPETVDTALKGITLKRGRDRAADTAVLRPRGRPH